SPASPPALYWISSASRPAGRSTSPVSASCTSWPHCYGCGSTPRVRWRNRPASLGWRRRLWWERKITHRERGAIHGQGCRQGAEEAPEGVGGCAGGQLHRL